MDPLEKIKAFEVRPPEGLWDQIAEKLDQSDAAERLATKIQAVAIQPPAGIWDRIAQTLDEEAPYLQLGQRLQAIEVPPPTAAWNQISCQLDDSQALQIIEQKLADMEMTPPAAAWTHIRAELEGRTPARLVPISGAHGWLKYAAAACVIAIFSITGYFIFSDGGDAAPYTAQDKTSAKSGYAGSPGDNGRIQTVKNQGTRRVSTPQEQMMATVRTKLGNTYTTTLEKNRELEDRYIVLMTQDGNIVRMSKKLGKMADCIAGADHSCDEQISKWQKEMAAMPASATPDNLLSILDMASGEQPATPPDGM
ncbi:hypothetical protein GCM10027051_28370 [Niabella terrae]